MWKRKKVPLGTQGAIGKRLAGPQAVKALTGGPAGSRSAVLPSGLAGSAGLVPGVTSQPLKSSSRRPIDLRKLSGSTNARRKGSE